MGIKGYGDGVDSRLEPVYVLPHFSIGKTPYHWIDVDAFRKVQVTSITESGLLVFNFDNQTIRLAPGNSWNKQIRPPCGERIRIENHGFLTGGLDIVSQSG